MMAITSIFMMNIANAADKAIKVDPELAKYKSAPDISGTITSIGSDTMNNVMALWLDEFAKHYPEVKHSMEGKGSGTAPPALIAGTAQLGPMSRPMKPSEIDSIEEKYGYKPTRLKTAMDALAVFVHRDNPIKSLTLAQVDSIFSKTRKRKHTEVTTWGDLGLTENWADKPIQIYGRNSASGTYLYFKKSILKKGDYKDTVKEQPGSATVVQSVTEDQYAIGYSGMGYKTSGVRTVPISKETGADAYDAVAQHVASGKYPISRFLNVYILKHPNKELKPIMREFVHYMFTQEGQMAVAKDGFISLTKAQAAKELDKVQAQK